MNKLSPILSLLAAVLLPTLAGAQSYSINWYKIAGGGGSSAGTNGSTVYAISGTIGQPDAGGTLTGGGYSLTGGFWALNTVPTPGAPPLTITYANNQASISWPAAATGWTLQTSGNLAAPNWINYPGTVVNNTVTYPSPVGVRFFRLVHP